MSIPLPLHSWPWAYFLNGPNAAASIAPTLIRHWGQPLDQWSNCVTGPATPLFPPPFSRWLLLSFSTCVEKELLWVVRACTSSMRAHHVAGPSWHPTKPSNSPTLSKYSRKRNKQENIQHCAVKTSLCSATSVDCKRGTTGICWCAPCSNRYLPPPGLGGFAAVGPCWDSQTDVQTDSMPLHRPCFAHYAGSADEM